MTGGVVAVQRMGIVGAGKVVPYHETASRAALLDIGLFQQARGQMNALATLLDIPAGRLDVLAEQKRSISPTLDIQIVVQVVLDDDVRPRLRDVAIGTRTNGQPIIRLFAKRTLTRVDEDMRIGALGSVHYRATRIVIIGILACGAPLHVHFRLHDRFHPIGTHVVGQKLRHVTRAFADFVAQKTVRRVQKKLQVAVRSHTPHTRGAAEAHHGFTAVAINELLELVRTCLDRLIPANALPTRILAFCARTLHRIQQAIRMVGRLQARLRFRTRMTAIRWTGLVTLHLDYTTILNGDPHTALHLAATAATTAYMLNVCRLIGVGALGMHER